MVEMMEEDPDLVKTFSKYVQKQYGSRWDKLQPNEKELLVKQEMTKNRIPRKGGKKTRKEKNTKRKAYTKKNRNKKRTLLKHK